MGLEKSEAIVLKAFNWSESSRTVIFFCRDFGKRALIDRGGRAAKSKRGRLHSFSRLEITFYASHKPQAYLSDLSLIRQYSFEAEGSLGRLAYASAGIELLNMLLPDAEPQVALYNYFCSYLESIESVPREALPSVFLTFFMRLLSFLGYHPSLGRCVVCQKTVNEFEPANGRYSVSAKLGGVVCPACQRVEEYYIPVSREDLEKLVGLQASSLKEAASVRVSFSEASDLLDILIGHLKYQADIVTDLKSLVFLEKLKNSQFSIR